MIADQAVTVQRQCHRRVDHAAVPLLQLDHCFDRSLAFLRDEIGQFVKLSCHVLIQLVIKLKQRHHGVIVIPGTVLHRCHNLIAIGRAVQQGRHCLIASTGDLLRRPWVPRVRRVRPGAPGHEVTDG